MALRGRDFGGAFPPVHQGGFYDGTGRWHFVVVVVEVEVVEVVVVDEVVDVEEVVVVVVVEVVVVVSDVVVVSGGKCVGTD